MAGFLLTYYPGLYILIYMKDRYRVALVYPRLVHQLHGLWAPLGILGVAAAISDSDIDIRVFDLTFDADTVSGLKALKSFNPHAVGIGYLTEFAGAVKEIATSAKKELGAKVFIGGPHPTILPLETLEDITDADVVTIGEAEETAVELVRAFKLGAPLVDIRGIAYRTKSGELRLNKARPFNENLDSLPFPARDMLPTLKSYLKGQALSLHAIRGCPFKCAFCQPTLDTLFGKKVRHRSPGNVADEIEMLTEKYDIREYFFVDDIFTLDKRWLADVAREFSSRKITPASRFVVNSRVDLLSEDVAELLVALNCYYVLLGIESGSQQVLDSLGKGTTTEQARTAFSVAKKKGLRTHAYVLLGSPEETLESLKATEDVIMEIEPDTIHISIYTPLPGTFLREKCLKDGKLTWDGLDDLDYYTPATVKGELPVRNENVSYDDVLATRTRILKRRKSKLFLQNARDLAGDLISSGGISKALFRYKLYRRMNHYFG